MTQENDKKPGLLSAARVRFEIYKTDKKGSRTLIGSYTERCNLLGVADRQVKLGKGSYSITAAIVNDGYYAAASDTEDVGVK